MAKKNINLVKETPPVTDATGAARDRDARENAAREAQANRDAGDLATREAAAKEAQAIANGDKPNPSATEEYKRQSPPSRPEGAAPGSVPTHA